MARGDRETPRKEMAGQALGGVMRQRGEGGGRRGGGGGEIERQSKNPGRGTGRREGTQQERAARQRGASEGDGFLELRR